VLDNISLDIRKKKKILLVKGPLGWKNGQFFSAEIEFFDYLVL
jgi:hypothetical protein